MITIVEAYIDTDGIHADVYFGDDDILVSKNGTITLTLDQWNSLRGAEDGSDVAAITAAEWSSLRPEPAAT